MVDDLTILLKRQKLLADFGDFALQSEDLQEVLTEACRLVAEAMQTTRAKVLEIEQGGETLLVRAGVGWDDAVVGKVRLSMHERSSETYSITERKPVITQDIATEDRFGVPEFMKAAGVVALVNVPILLPGGRAFGLLQVDATEPRAFGQDDIEFLRTYGSILGPIVDRLLKLNDLRATREQFRLTVEAAKDYAILTIDTEGRITDWLPGAENVFGWSKDEILGKSTSILFTPEDRRNGEDRKELQQALTQGVAPDVRRHMRKDGSTVFIEGSLRALRQGQHATSGLIKIGQDITERHRLEERQQVLLAELQHRTLNLMAVVRSVADQTVRGSSSLAEFGPRFRERIAALSRVQGLLSRLHEGERVAFDEIVEGELTALGGEVRNSGRVTLDGPRGVKLRSSAVQILALGIHELGTNALKYGALGQAGGHLAVRWKVVIEEGHDWLHVDWRETGVSMPPSNAAPQGGGAGRELIERALPYQLGAKTTYVMEANGVHCQIALPIAGRASGGSIS